MIIKEDSGREVKIGQISFEDTLAKLKESDGKWPEIQYAWYGIWKVGDKYKIREASEEDRFFDDPEEALNEFDRLCVAVQGESPFL